MVDLQTLVIYGFVLAIPALYLSYRHIVGSPRTQRTQSTQANPPQPQKTIMQAAREDLLPPKDDPFTTEELKKYDGSDPKLPIYLAIKGTIFDVTHKAEVYGPGKSYGIFAGKDASRGLGMSSLKPEHAVADYSDLDEKDRQVLEDWYSFFSKRYNVVGKVVDPPVGGSAGVSSL